MISPDTTTSWAVYLLASGYLYTPFDDKKRKFSEMSAQVENGSAFLQLITFLRQFFLSTFQYKIMPILTSIHNFSNISEKL